MNAYLNPAALRTARTAALLSVAYFAFFFALQLFLVRCDFFHTPVTEKGLSYWDVGFYHSIATEGYLPGNNNAGFYPLFPLLWKLVGSSVWAGVTLNIILFSAGFGLLCALLGVVRQEMLPLLSIPSLCFMAVPYTEALFFLLFSAALWGLYKNASLLTALSLLLLACTRATAIMVVPAMVLAQLLSHPRTDWWRQIRFIVLAVVLPVAAGTLLFLAWQYHATGIWGAYFKTQATVWEHKLDGPKFPLSNDYGGERMKWLDALAFFTGIYCLICIAVAGVRWLRDKRFTADALTMVAYGYIGFITVSTLLYNPQNGGRTMCIGLQRYIFASPAFMIVVRNLVRLDTRSWRMWAGMALLANGTYLAFGSYQHITEWLFYNFITLLVALYIAAASPRGESFRPLLFGVGFLLQLLMFQQFLIPLYLD